jgi:hypothetical protein
LQRKRARPGISYAKSVSFRRWNSSRLRAGVMGQRTRSVSAAENTGRSVSGTTEPSIRRMGGLSVQMWMSEALRSIIIRKNCSISAALPVPVGALARAAGAGAAGGAAARAGGAPPGV